MDFFGFHIIQIAHERIETIIAQIFDVFEKYLEDSMGHI